MHCPAGVDAFVSSYRQDAAKRQTAGIVFTHRAKIRVFAPHGRLVAPIQVKLCRTDGHLGPLGCAKFRINRCRGVGMWPPNSITMRSLGKIVQRAPAVGAKIWCLSLCSFVCHATSPERRAFEGAHSLNTHCVAVYRLISTRFAAFFSEMIALSDTLHSSHIRHYCGAT